MQIYWIAFKWFMWNFLVDFYIGFNFNLYFFGYYEKRFSLFFPEWFYDLFDCSNDELAYLDQMGY